MSDLRESVLLFEPDPGSESRLHMRFERTERSTSGNVIRPRVFERARRDIDKVFRPLPSQLIRRYAERAAVHARIDQLEGGRWYGDVYGLRGVWADGDTPDAVRMVLSEVVEDWVMLKIARGDRDIPTIETIDLNAL